MRKNRDILLYIFSHYLFSSAAFANSDLAEVAGATFRLRQDVVVRYYEQCMKQTESDAECRAELTALHPREKAALRGIFVHSRSYDEYQISKAIASCYDPSHNYLDYIECSELLASKMAAGEDIELDEPKPDASLVETLTEKAAAVFLQLTPTKKRSIVLCVRERVNINFQETVAHNLNGEGDDVLWALKIYALESAQISELAALADWVELAGYYDKEAGDAEKLIRGEIELDTYKSFSKDNDKMLGETLASERSWWSAHQRNFQYFSRECDELSVIIVGNAKIAASQ